MIAVWMVQMPVNKVVDVITMRDWFVAASGAMDMVRIVAAARVVRSAALGIGVIHFQSVFFNLSIRADVMHVAIVEVIDVISVLDACVFTIGAVLVIVVGVQICHLEAP